MIVLDTNVVSEVLKPVPEPHIVDWLAHVPPGTTAITAITLAELYGGLELLPEGKRKYGLQRSIEQAVAPYRDHLVIPFDSQAAIHYSKVVALRTQGGVPIDTAYAQIAAVCLSRSATLATRNTKDFRHTGVHVINPWLSF